MRISDLSQASGVPVATIKFYLREGLLPAGRSTVRNRAEYGEEHLARLRLARILILVGRRSVASVREVFAAADDGRGSVQDLRRLVNRVAPTEPEAPGDTADAELARARVDELIDRLGWRVADDAPGRHTLAQVLAALGQLGQDDDIVTTLVPYGALAQRLAAGEDPAAAGPAVAMVARTVLFEVALVALSRLAHEHCPLAHSIS